MKLLVITQKVDKEDSILGFFHRWIEEFANHTEKVTVICLEEGRHELPPNVEVLSLGKEKTKSKLKYITAFYRYIWLKRHEYQEVFVHMNPEYVVLGGLLWKIWHKNISLWYVHRQTNFKLRVAEILAGIVFTSSPESFNLKSKKVKYLGHGIDTKKFTFSEKTFDKPLSLLYVGRITKIKNIDTIFNGLRNLLDNGIKIESLSLIGEPITQKDQIYTQELHVLAKNLSLETYIKWLNSVPNYKMSGIYSEAQISINASPDGGMDKSVLESIASGCATFVSNSAFEKLFENYSSDFKYKSRDSVDLTQKIISFLKNENKDKLIFDLSKKVAIEYDISSLVSRVISNINESATS
jgi:glycosyltransferase involved in cell wall biosynthesis